MLPVSPKFSLNSRPSLSIMWSSVALHCLYHESVVISTSSCSWPRKFNFMFFKTRSTSCPTRIRAFALIPFIKYDVVFPSIYVNSFTLDSKEGDSSFCTHCFAFCRDCSFRSRVCFFWLALVVCFCGENLFLISDSWGRCGHFNGYCLDTFPAFETYLFCDFEFQSGEKISRSYYEVKLKQIIICIPQCWQNCFRLEKTRDRFVICQNNCWFVASHRKCAYSSNAM